MPGGADYHAPNAEGSMHLEKLDLLEDRLNRFVQHFARLKEERAVLERSLVEATGRVAGLEREVGELRQERDVVRDRLARLVETIERLEALESGSGADA